MARKASQREPIPFGRVYARSQTFRDLFQDGMTLVEETANYLDGAGRAAAKQLERPASVVYATESMRLTTRLMQLASWLLLHRSVNEGDMTLDQALTEKRKIKMDRLPTNMSGPGWDQLPEEFRALVTRSLALQIRVERIDATILEDETIEATGTNPVRDSLEELASALKVGT